MSADPDRTIDFRPEPAPPGDRFDSESGHPDPRAEVTAEVAGVEETLGMKPFRPRGPDPDLARDTLEGGQGEPSMSKDWPAQAVGYPGFELGDVLGDGGAGVVYKARQLSPDRTVALKVLKKDAPDARDLGRFRREFQVVAGIRHDNIVRVYDSGEADGRPYLVLEYCPGGSLTDRLKARGCGLPPTQAADLVRKVARGVAAAHALGVVHRDLKPGNILFDAAGEPKVADFGLAKGAAQSSELTRAGDIMGTPHYMAPEQAAGEAKGAGPPADVWSLGVILYECLTGFPPFTGPSNIAVLAKVQAADPDPVGKLAAGVHPDLAAVCHRCLEKDPRDRYPDAGKLADALSLVVAGLPLPPRSGIARRWLWGVGAVLVTGGLAAGGWWATRPAPLPAATPGGEQSAQAPAETIPDAPTCVK